MKFHTILIIAHLLALALGFGAALIADLTVARRALFRPINDDVIETMDFLGKLVTVGLVLVWVSGVVLVAEMALSGSPILKNPKFWAKVVIVEILTINGVAVHALVLPALRAQKGRSLFEGLGTLERMTLGAIGATSLTSWCFPIFLGTARELNMIVPMSAVLTAYFICLGLAVSVGVTLALVLGRGSHASQTMSPYIAASMAQAATPSLSTPSLPAQAVSSSVMDMAALPAALAEALKQINQFQALHALVQQAPVASAPMTQPAASLATATYQAAAAPMAPALQPGHMEPLSMLAPATPMPAMPALQAAANPAPIAQLASASAPAQPSSQDALDPQLMSALALIAAYEDMRAAASTPSRSAEPVAAKEIRLDEVTKPALGRNLFALPPVPPASPVPTAVLTPRPATQPGSIANLPN